MARVFTFRRTLVQTRKRGHTAIGAACYRLALAAESRFTGTDGAPRSFDFTKRHGIGPAGCKLPKGASDAWRDPLEWARRIEAVDYRSNSRQFRDDVIGIPRELIAAGKAEEAIAKYAQRIASKWRTPVHYVIHDEHGKNPHGHVMYAGRALDGADQFDKKRDREQDQKPNPKRGELSITELHSQFWIETLRGFGHEASFEAKNEDGKAQDHIGPQAWAREKKAIQNEIAAAITQALDPDQPIDAGDAMKAARAATADLTVTDALALDRDPVTAEMILARKPIREMAPAVALERPNVRASLVALDPPQRTAAPAIALARAHTPQAAPLVALDPPLRPAAAAIVLPPALSPRAVPVVALEPPQRSAAARIEHEPPITRPAPAIALEPPQRPAAPLVALAAPERPRPAPLVALSAPEQPRPAPLVVLDPPQRTAAPAVRLPVPTHILEARRLKDAEKWEAEAKAARVKTARDRLDGAITVATAEEVAETLIESHAGHASAYPSFVTHGIGSKASAAAVDRLRPIVKPHQVAERNRRTKARTDRQYLDAVKRAIGGFRRWWRARAWGEKENRGETIVREVIAAVWPTHLQETEDQHARITRELEEKRERQAKARGHNQYRPQLVETAETKAKRPGGHGGHSGGGFEH